ncbi:MAG TPA: SpoIIE family protein phosphatase [Acidimicrobiales bacterium]|nr:SpoIIE family protein phosphatase [Acidimicrobiales bacterium]
MAEARTEARHAVIELGYEGLTDDVELVVSELVTNAILHAGGLRAFNVRPVDGGVRLEVRDDSPDAPVLGWLSPDSMTGRGLRLVASIASRFGAEPDGAGKNVWAEVTGASGAIPDLDADELIRLWADDPAVAPRYHVVLGEVPTDLLLAAKAHVDSLVREFALADAGARSGVTEEMVPDLSTLVDVVMHRFVAARDAIKRQALAAAEAGHSHASLELDLDVDDADAAEDYMHALDALDEYCRAARLLTLETPPQHRVFRHWYIDELVRQPRELSAGKDPAPAMTFERRLLHEIDHVASARMAAERTARLYEVARALVGASAPEEVASAVLEQGVAALRASGGGLLLATDADRLLVPGTVGYHPDVVGRLRAESPSAELPAAESLRTGEPVWIESSEERDERFPDLVAMEPDTVSVCAVPLEIGNRRLGALRFSFDESRLFDEHERRFVLALAAQAAQALDRAQLQAVRLEVSERLQRSLLPPRLPAIPGMEVAAIYRPFGDGLEVGGDFYDLWPIDDHGFGFAMGDVSGRGPEAAAVTALVRYSLRALTRLEPDPVRTLTTLNDVLGAASEERGADETFCTAVFGIIRISGPGRVEVVMVSGGHPFPLVRRGDGRIEEVRLGGTLLGALPAVAVAEARVALAPGDLLILYTDGVVEARDSNGAMFDLQAFTHGLDGGLREATEVVRALEEAVIDHVGGVLEDDVAALVLHVAGGT